MKRIVKLIAGAVLAVCGGAWAGAVSGVSQEVEMTILPSGADVAKSVLVQCPLLGAESVSAIIDGTLSFWWRVDCEPDPGKRFTWDRGVLTIDGKDIDKKDGITEWMNHSVTFDTAGEHEIVLAYISDGYLPVEDDVYAGCMWADGFVWTPKEEFPALDASATKEMLSQVLSEAADAKLSANIKTAAEYSAFRSWVKGLLGTSQDQVKDSPNAWLSYVLDAGSLIEGTVSDERVQVEELAVGGESCIFDMKLRIADVSIGAGATVANLLRVFAVEGTASLADEDFSVEKVAVLFGEPDNGAISLAVTPRQTGNAFFVRTRLRDQLNGDRMNGCEVSFNLNGGGSLPEGMSAKKFVVKTILLRRVSFSPAPVTATRLRSTMPVRSASIGRPFRIRTTTTARGTSSSIRVTTARAASVASSGILFVLSKGSPNSERM